MRSSFLLPAASCDPSQAGGEERRLSSALGELVDQLKSRCLLLGFQKWDGRTLSVFPEIRSFGWLCLLLPWFPGSSRGLLSCLLIFAVAKKLNSSQPWLRCCPRFRKRGCDREQPSTPHLPSAQSRTAPP